MRGRSYEIAAEIALPASGAATEFGLRLRTNRTRHTTIGYDTGAGELFVDRTASGPADFTEHFAGRSSTPVPLTSVDGERRLRVHLFMGTSAVEVLGGDGRATLTSLLLPEPDAQGMSFCATGGAARIVTLDVHRLADVFRVTDRDQDRPAPPARESSAPAASVRSPSSRPAAGPPPGRAGPATATGTRPRSPAPSTATSS
ncbi:GH32 C-terminal domain-containing protein [Streptomyces anulatus]